MSDGGKGSKPRPFSVSKDIFDTNWDKIFGNKKEKTDYQDILSTEDSILDSFENKETDKNLG